MFHNKDGQPVTGSAGSRNFDFVVLQKENQWYQSCGLYTCCRYVELWHSFRSLDFESDLSGMFICLVTFCLLSTVYRKYAKHFIWHENKAWESLSLIPFVLFFILFSYKLLRLLLSYLVSKYFLLLLQYYKYRKQTVIL